jgi:hypothetical protein
MKKVIILFFTVVFLTGNIQGEFIWDIKGGMFKFVEFNNLYKDESNIASSIGIKIRNSSYECNLEVTKYLFKEESTGVPYSAYFDNYITELVLGVGKVSLKENGFRKIIFGLGTAIRGTGEDDTPDDSSYTYNLIRIMYVYGYRLDKNMFFTFDFGFDMPHQLFTRIGFAFGTIK